MSGTDGQATRLRARRVLPHWHTTRASTVKGVVGMPTRLSGLDAAFLYLETRTSHMHVGGMLVLDPSTAPEGELTYQRLLDYMEARIHLAPLLRRRLAWVPFNLDHPLWIDDPDFDLRFHVRRAALPQPGGMAELAEFAGDVMGRPVDKARPLWELHVIEMALAGLPPAQRQALILRDIEGFGGEEVRNFLGVTGTNQRVLLHRARSAVRRALEAYFEDEG
jgi:hypothetical protein